MSRKQARVTANRVGAAGTLSVAGKKVPCGRCGISVTRGGNNTGRIAICHDCRGSDKFYVGILRAQPG
jgi:hypothetical protein